MIRGLLRPRVILSAAGAAWLLAVGVALNAANVVPTTHAGVVRVSLPEMLLPAAVRIEPETLNLGSEAGDGTVSIFLSLPLPHQASEIIPSSVELCLGQRCVSGDGSWNLAGNSTLQSKFDREVVRGLLQGAHGWVTLDAHGDLSVPPGHFQGSDAVVVLD
ncbi:MAG TPA: hypothetical protein VGA41_07920 [Candidatus Dormibacteraeota bacterium]